MHEKRDVIVRTQGGDEVRMVGDQQRGDVRDVQQLPQPVPGFAVHGGVILEGMLPWIRETIDADTSPQFHVAESAIGMAGDDVNLVAASG